MAPTTANGLLCIIKAHALGYQHMEEVVGFPIENLPKPRGDAQILPAHSRLQAKQGEVTVTAGIYYCTSTERAAPLHRSK